eukprot:gene34708-42809_t
MLSDKFLQAVKDDSNGSSKSKDVGDLLEEGMECYENAIMLGGEVDSVLTEYMKLASKYGSNRQKMHTISFANTLFRSKLKGVDDLEGTSNAGNVISSAKAILEKMSGSLK